jgi:Arc/MetJ family transcription regulator
MRFTVAINEELIKEAMRVSKKKTKREAIEVALKEMVRRQRLKEAILHAGEVKMAISKEKLEKERADREWK